jgi:hypothetical protein
MSLCTLETGGATLTTLPRPFGTGRGQDSVIPTERLPRTFTLGMTRVPIRLRRL